MALSSQMQKALEAKEREMQQLAEGQRELEAKLHHLSSTKQEANSENQQLREAERDLAGQLEEVRGRLQVTRKHLNAARGRVSWQMQEETSVSRADEMAQGPQAISPEEAPLPRLFGDHEDWGQLLSSIHSPPHTALQLSWSPPPTPRAASSPQTPRVVRQISISEPHTSLFGQEPSSDPDGAPRIPPRVTSSTKNEKGVDPEGQDVNPEQPVENLPNPDHSEEPESRPKGHFLWDIPGAGESGSLVAAALKVLTPLEGEPPSHVNSLLSQAQAGPSKHSDTDDKGPGPDPAPAKPPRQIEVLHHNLYATGSESGAGAQRARTLILKPAGLSLGLESVGDPTEDLGQGKPGLAQGKLGLAVQEAQPEELREGPGQSLEKEPKAEEGKQVDGGEQDLGLEQSAEVHGLQTGPSGLPQQDTQPAPLTPDSPQTGPAAFAFGKPSPPRDSPPLSSMGAWPGAAAGLQEPTQAMSTIIAELEAQPRPQPMTAHSEEQGPPQSREPRAERRPEDLETGSREAELTPSLGDPMANQPQANPDYLFHVIFLGDSNVGKTSFLHLLHQNSFATGMTATVGVDFQVKNLLVDNKCFALQLWDTAGQERYHSITRQLLRKADGIVLMYDVTSQESFAHVRYWLDCLQDTGLDGVVILLLGNKTDCEEERQVPTEAGQQLAQELGVSFGECSAALGHNILEPIVNLARSLKMQEDRLKGSLVEVAPKKPHKKAACCF
uniref:RAB44, member RAS oncogene family n=1 Tax=Otolemur garnettii TaxID=30611 RepID=H0XZU9_OTOGA